jgi:putative Mg2+ transporter-C (MgtC) family protein
MLGSVEITQTQIDMAVRIAVAAGFGMVIGIERELREHAAGLRTHMLVAVGACLFTLVSVYGFEEFAGEGIFGPDPGRVAAQVVTGVGFLGAGAILREGLNVRGLTTAASLWIVAALGMAVGLGMFWASGIAVAVTVMSLWLMLPFRRRLRAVDEQANPPESPEPPSEPPEPE